MTKDNLNTELLGTPYVKKGMDMAMDKVELLMKLNNRCTVVDLQRFLDHMEYRRLHGMK